METEEHDFSPPPGPPPLLSADQLDSLCAHGWLPYALPQQLSDDIERLNASAAAFFQRGAHDKSSAFISTHGTERGYYHVPEEKEYVTFRCASSPEPSDLEAQAGHVWAQISRLLHRILCDLSRAGGLDARAWDAIVAGSTTLPGPGADLRDLASLMRVFRYEPATGIAEQHTDLGLLTLCVGTGRGLEVLDVTGGAAQWVDASNCAILTGETLRALSHGGVRAGTHRVVGNPCGRQSLVFALRPNLAATVDGAAFGGVGTVALRQLFRDIKGRKYNVNARQDVRERQQLEQRELREKIREKLGSQPRP